jgi:hypothetical protein
LRQKSRSNPIGPGPVLETMLRLRAEAHDVRLVLAQVTLGAPRSAIEPALVTSA